MPVGGVSSRGRLLAAGVWRVTRIVLVTLLRVCSTAAMPRVEAGLLWRRVVLLSVRRLRWR